MQKNKLRLRSLNFITVINMDNRGTIDMISGHGTKYKIAYFTMFFDARQNNLKILLIEHNAFNFHMFGS